MQQAQQSLEKSIAALTDKIEQVNQLTIANTKARENEKDFEEKLRTAFTIKVEPRLVDAHGKDVQREINSVEPFSANFGGSMSTQKWAFIVNYASTVTELSSFANFDN